MSPPSPPSAPPHLFAGVPQPADRTDGSRSSSRHARGSPTVGHAPARPTANGPRPNGPRPTAVAEAFVYVDGTRHEGTLAWFDPKAGHVTLTTAAGQVLDLRGQLHRADDKGPTVQDEAGNQSWFRHGVVQRVARADGTQRWYLNGRPGRADGGPAVVHPDGSGDYFEGGRFVRHEPTPTATPAIAEAA